MSRAPSSGGHGPDLYAEHLQLLDRLVDPFAVHLDQAVHVHVALPDEHGRPARVIRF
jgi:hypothetical protein